MQPQQILQQATLIHSADAVNQAIESIAKNLNDDYTQALPIVLCVMGGGVYFTGQLLPKLNFALALDYVQATRYHNDTAGKDLHWIIQPKDNINGRNVLILDDILDEGITLKAIVDACHVLGAKQIKIAVLVEKSLNKIKPIQADYIGLQVPNQYVFGCGMDVNGWWRNLPAIYAYQPAK